MTRPISISKLQTGDADLDRVQEHLREKLNPVLASLPVSADFRWTEMAGADKTQPGVWALQFRTAGTTWTTVASFTSAGQIVQPAWIAFPYAANWSNLGGGNPLAGYFKDAQGFVHLRGLTKWSQATNPIPAGTVIGTLPVGYRPSLGASFAVANWSGVYTAGVIDVLSDGSVRVQVGSNGGANTSGPSFDGITFDTRS